MYNLLGEIVVAHSGEIVKYIGDGMLCTFPPGVENDAVSCALKLRVAFADLVAQRSLPLETELEVGIDTGRVAIGVFGHPSLRQKDVFGETVLHAAAIGHHRGVAITEQVYERVKTDFETHPLPARTVKWQEEPLRAWEVVA
jgi:class 3 adenylate cyclase